MNNIMPGMCKLKWFTFGELQKIDQLIDLDKFTYRVTSWPLSNCKDVPPKVGVYIYHPDKNKKR